jgi:filamentous hemagglutinin
VAAWREHRCRGNGAGISVFANVNAAKGKDKGNGTDWTETTLDSGKTVTIKSGNDTVLNGAQVNGNKIVADVGHDLLMRSQQDNNDYDSKQTSVAAGGSFTFGSMTGSGYISASQDKMKSRFDSWPNRPGCMPGMVVSISPSATTPSLMAQLLLPRPRQIKTASIPERWASRYP